MNNFKNVLEIIEEFNNKNNIEDVIKTITGATIKGKSLCCPIHGGDNKHGASINARTNVFSCWTGACGRGLTPWQFVKKYYNLSTFKEVAQKVNQLFNANIPIFDKNKQKNITKEEFDVVYNVDRYLSEANNMIKKELEECNHILLNANTGLGKTYAIVDFVTKNNTDDYVFFLVPTRSIAEQVSKDYPMFQLFYDNDTQLPCSKFIVSTYHKIHHLQRAIERETEQRCLLGEFPPTYAVIVDEVHEIMSKRKLLSAKARNIELFLKNADRSILMSANTDYVYKAYKDKNMFNKYICVKARNIEHNADNLNIYRISNKSKQQKQVVVNLIKDKLSKYDKVLFYEDNIDNLNEYAKKLNELNIENVVINSKNKNDEEVEVDYKGIIEDSHLLKKVVFTTSLINAGINIKDNNICLIAKQNKNTFDVMKLEQFLARVRTTKNDLNVILTNSDNVESKNIVSFEPILNNLMQMSSLTANNFNLNLFATTGLNCSNNEVEKIFKTYRNNDAYKNFADVLYVENASLKVDDVAVVERARLNYERMNYYNNTFILDTLDRVKAKNKNVITIAPLSCVEEEDKKDSEKGKKDEFRKDLKLIKDDIKAVTELYKLAIREVKSKDLEIIKDFHQQYNQNKIYKEMMKNLRECLNNIANEEEVNKTLIFTQILELYVEDNKKKIRDNAIDNIRRVEIYNKIVEVNAPREKLELVGDYTYIATRKNFDCYILNNNPVSKRCYDWALNDLLELKKLEVLDDKYYIDNKGKKVKRKDVIKKLKDCISAIYDISNKGFMIGLN